VARFFQREFPIEVDLHVVAMRGYRRSMIWLGKAVPEAPLIEKAIESEVKSGESIPYAPAITVGAWLALVSEM
jgi:hypothetical protein